MTRTSINCGLVGTWNGTVTFSGGPRRGEHERLRLTFLPDGVIVGAGEVAADRHQLPPAAGEWDAVEDRFSYRLNAVLSDPSGHPTTVVYAHAEGRLAGDGRTLTASGGSEVYGPSGELLVTNSADLDAIRAEPA